MASNQAAVSSEPLACPCCREANLPVMSTVCPHSYCLGCIKRRGRQQQDDWVSCPICHADRAFKVNEAGNHLNNKAIELMETVAELQLSLSSARENYERALQKCTRDHEKVILALEMDNASLFSENKKLRESLNAKEKLSTDPLQKVKDETSPIQTKIPALALDRARTTIPNLKRKRDADEKKHDYDGASKGSLSGEEEDSTRKVIHHNLLNENNQEPSKKLLTGQLPKKERVSIGDRSKRKERKNQPGNGQNPGSGIQDDNGKKMNFEKEPPEDGAKKGSLELDESVGSELLNPSMGATSQKLSRSITPTAEKARISCKNKNQELCEDPDDTLEGRGSNEDKDCQDNGDSHCADGGGHENKVVDTMISGRDESAFALMALASQATVATAMTEQCGDGICPPEHTRTYLAQALEKVRGKKGNITIGSNRDGNETKADAGRDDYMSLVATIRRHLGKSHGSGISSDTSHSHDDDADYQSLVATVHQHLGKVNASDKGAPGVALSANEIILESTQVQIGNNKATSFSNNKMETEKGGGDISKGGDANNTVIPTNGAENFIENPGPHDVVLGRGGGCNNHSGNINFRKLVNQHRMRYLAAPKQKKPDVARQVVREWRKLDPPGRFLARRDQLRGPSSILKSVQWYEVGDKKAREKASQCLRERTPDALAKMQQLRKQQNNVTASAIEAQHRGDDELGDIHEKYTEHQQQHSLSEQPSSTQEGHNAILALAEQRLLAQHGQLPPHLLPPMGLGPLGVALRDQPQGGLPPHLLRQQLLLPSSSLLRQAQKSLPPLAATSQNDDDAAKMELTALEYHQNMMLMHQQQLQMRLRAQQQGQNSNTNAKSILQPPLSKSDLEHDDIKAKSHSVPKKKEGNLG